jgi:hypothetical protein
MLAAILLTFVSVTTVAIRSRAEAIHEVGFTRKLKPYFSKTDFAVWVCKNEKYRTGSGLAFALNATG